MNNKLIAKSIVTILGILFLAACANNAHPIPIVTVQESNNLQITAINNLRVAFGIPDSPLESKGTDTMINSPSGNARVALYTDSEGRKYSVDPETSTVVEMDARDLLASIPTNAPALSQADIKAKVNKMLALAIPGFNTLSQALSYEEGGKVDNYFFNWYASILPGQFNRPFVQVGVYKTGFIFTYYNTITLK